MSLGWLALRMGVVGGLGMDGQPARVAVWLSTIIDPRVERNCVNEEVGMGKLSQS